MDLYEINSLALLLMTKISPSNDTSLKNYIETSIYTFVAEVLETVAEKYFITQMSEELVLNLSLHVSNLIYRAKNGKQVRNPLSEEIKHSYAFIYEVAVFIAQKIQQKIKLPISDDEITFIAMHIGSYFEEKFETENKLSCVIYTPEYYDMHERLVYKIDEKFNSQLNIVDTFYRLDSNALVKMRQADLVLSTIEIKELDKAIQLSPFLSGKDLEKIQAEIQTVQQRKVLNTLKKSIQTYLTPEHFKRNIYLDSPDDYIDYLGTQLVQTDYIEPSFIDLIKAREKMSATSFNNAVALPHAMEMTAKKTGISIILNDYPVKWGTYYVQVIIIIVMNKTDMKKFRQLFDFMIDTFSEQEKLHQLLSTQNYTAFIDTLFE
ncbi:BglG family transcription antiterminator [Enterococcus rivorum]